MKNIARKNQIIITTLAIMIAVAGFLNYSGKIDLNNDAQEASADGTDVSGAATGVSADVSDISDEDIYVQAQNTIANTEVADTSADATEVSDVSAEASQSAPGEAVLANAAVVTTIADLKLTREQTRSKNKETLMEIVNSTNVTDEQKQNAVDEMVELTDIAEKEAAAEILLEAKGFADVVVNIENGTADVIVNVSELGDVERARIEDIVKRKTGLSGENIVITTLSSTK